jgi:WD40 repeat protein
MSSVVLATAGYDHTIKFWEATSGICYRTLQFPDSQVSHLVGHMCSCFARLLHFNTHAHLLAFSLCLLVPFRVQNALG